MTAHAITALEAATRHAVHSRLAIQNEPRFQVRLDLIVCEFDAVELMALRTSSSEALRRIGSAVAQQVEHMFCLFCGEEAQTTVGDMDDRGMCTTCKQETPRCVHCGASVTRPQKHGDRCGSCPNFRDYRSG